MMEVWKFVIYLMLVFVILSVMLQFSINRRSELHSVKMGKLIEQNRMLTQSIQLLQTQLIQVNQDIQRCNLENQTLKISVMELSRRVDDVQRAIQQPGLLNG